MDRLTPKVAARFAALDVGYGPAGTSLTFGKDFAPTTECNECGKDARLALTVKEPPKETTYVRDLYPSEEGDDFWPSEAAAFAVYICPDPDCAEATTIWNEK